MYCTHWKYLLFYIVTISFHQIEISKKYTKQFLCMCVCVCYLLNKFKLLRLSMSFSKLKTAKAYYENQCTFKILKPGLVQSRKDWFYQLYFNKRTIYLHETMVLLFFDHSKSPHYIWFYFISNRLYTRISRAMHIIAIFLQHRKDMWDQFFFSIYFLF